MALLVPNLYIRGFAFDACFCSLDLFPACLIFLPYLLWGVWYIGSRWHVSWRIALLLSMLVGSVGAGCIFFLCGSSGCFCRFLVGVRPFSCRQCLVGIFLVQFPIALVLLPMLVLPDVSVSFLSDIFSSVLLEVCSCSIPILALRCQFFLVAVFLCLVPSLLLLRALVLGTIWRVFLDGCVVRVHRI